MQQSTVTEKLVLSILISDDIAAIWHLQLAAADAFRTGHPRSAEAVLEIADAAEAAWLSARERLEGLLSRMGAYRSGALSRT